MRAVVSCFESPRKTRFGHPDHYHFQLECGHERISCYGVSEFLAAYQLRLYEEGKIDAPPRLKCYECSRQKRQKEVETRTA